MFRLVFSALIATSCATASTAPVAAAPAPHIEHEHEHEGAGHSGGGHDWDDTYREGKGFSLKPNALLASSIQGRKPGTALDIGMGQGRNAVYLATQGWSVTGVDTAAEGIRIAKENAAAAKISLNAVVDDADHFDMGKGQYDLVALMYVGGAEMTSRIDTALKPGGLVVVEYFHKDMERQFGHQMGAFGSGELESLYKGYKVIRSEVVEDTADFGLRPAKLVRFVAQKP